MGVTILGGNSMAAEQTSTKPSAGGTHAFPVQRKTLFLATGIFIIAALAIFLIGNNSSSPLTPPLPAGVTTTIEGDATVTTLNPLIVDPRTTLLKSRYIKETYAIRRENYNIFEKSAQKHNETLDQTKQFFYDCCGLSSEEEIFSSLPAPPSNFSEVAYDIAVGNKFDIGTLGPEFYKQPEFYFIGTETAIVNQFWAFNPWIERALNYWGEYGGTAFPSKQGDVLSKSGRKDFTSTVFFTNGWNIQNFVGYYLVADSESQKYFDLTIEEENTGQPYFLLGPTFPRFDSTWATRLLVSGQLKEGTAAGTYEIHISPIAPPKDLEVKWSGEHAATYASYGALAPSDGFITLVITVTE